MRINPGGLTAILILGAALSGCAASMGTVAGNVAGGAEDQYGGETARIDAHDGTPSLRIVQEGR